MPPRLRDLKRALEAFGLLVHMPTSGSHWHVEGPGGIYPIPSHNGLKGEISDVYVRGVCRKFGIDPAELAKLL